MDQLFQTPLVLRACYLATHRKGNLILSSLGITSDQFVCMHFLSENEDVIQNEVVDYMYSDPNTVSSLLSLLIKKGYVEKTPCSKDRRARTVSLTAEGKRVCHEAFVLFSAFYSKVRAEISLGEGEKLNHLLTRYESVMSDQ